MGGFTAFWDMMTCPLFTFSDHNRLSGLKLADETPHSHNTTTPVSIVFWRFAVVCFIVRIKGFFEGCSRN